MGCFFANWDKPSEIDIINKNLDNEDELLRNTFLNSKNGPFDEIYYNNNN